MRISVKFVMTALVASLLLSAAVSTTSARNLSTSNQNLRATWTSIEFAVPGGSVSCRLTLEGSFHTRTIAKVRNSLVGAVTRAIASTCTGGTASMFNGTESYNGTTTPNTLPWHLTYDSFSGTLPNISAGRLLLSRFRFGSEISPCAVQIGNETDIIFADAGLDASGVINSLSVVMGLNLATAIRTDRDFLGACPRPGARGNLIGSGQVTVLNSSSRIRITLI